MALQSKVQGGEENFHEAKRRKGKTTCAGSSSLSRNTLLVNLRFLDVTLSRFTLIAQ
jgi:hypothetical protein